MIDKISLTEDEKDCLQELINISYGSATAAIAEVVEKFATLNTPKIDIVTLEGFNYYLIDKLGNSKTHYVTNQLINGTINSETMFIINEESTHNLGKEFDLDGNNIYEDELKDIVLEISNIITSTTFSKFASLIDAPVTFSPPSIKVLHSAEEFNDRYANEYSHIIVIATELKFKEQNIIAELLILSKDKTIAYIKEALNKVLAAL